MLHEVFDDSAHRGVNLLVVQCFFFVLQNDADGVRLLAGLEVLAFINIKEINAAQELALAVARKTKPFNVLSGTSVLKGLFLSPVYLASSIT